MNAFNGKPTTADAQAELAVACGSTINEKMALSN
jgi:hypothetical protein